MNSVVNAPNIGAPGTPLVQCSQSTHSIVCTGTDPTFLRTS